MASPQPESQVVSEVAAEVTEAVEPPPEPQAPPKPAPPRTVKSVVLTGYGAFDKLKVQAWPIPSSPGAGQVEVAVDTCGVNFADICVRRGLIKDRHPPFVLGLECAGTVSAIGEEVTSIKVGDRVICYQYTGDLYRETVILPAANCFLLPANIPFEHGAALAANYLTAYFSVLDIGHLRPGQSILIHSCAGGVGWAATQLARSVGSVTIFGTASPCKHDAARENGVTHVLNPDTYEAELLKLSPKGVDVVIDSLSGPNFAVSQKLLKPLGRVILIGINSMLSGHHKVGMIEMLKIAWSMKNVSTLDLVNGNRVVAGLHLGKLMDEEPERIRQAMEELFRFYKDGKIAPRIDSVWPLDQIVDASKHLSERKNIGKVLLRIGPPTSDAEKA
ncbi:synaptic vesicle membrane protein VAT-1 homolog [Anabrus simplex]|uniref:synaptic vesicle membrane protein VAT-1 homolog n=1 Tax=Anabrus simplex TaxID=316456 RepID=UPI0035A393FC